MDRDVSSGRELSAAMTAQGAALSREVKLQNDPSRCRTTERGPLAC
jgi:hypothetical protein